MFVISSEESLRKEIKKSQLSKLLLLPHLRLNSFPHQIWNYETISNLTRLDISYNNIQSIPAEISRLTSLKDIWFNNNPIETFPNGLFQLHHLESIDMRSTRISFIPNEIATLKHIFEIDWRDTPFAREIQSAHGIAINDLLSLMVLMNDNYTRQNLEIKLSEFLSGVHFASDADRPDFNELIEQLVQQLSHLFGKEQGCKLDDFRLFVGRAGILLPQKLNQINLVVLDRMKTNFYSMQRDTHRKRMSADVEIKLRNVYFDRIERSMVDDILHAIFEHVLSLEDIEFFVKYASQLLPPKPEQALDGSMILRAIEDLQAQLTEKRKNAEDSLFEALMQLYPEQGVELVREITNQASLACRQDLFATKRELNWMNHLTADCSRLFPPDFASIQIDEIMSQIKKK